MKNQNPLLKQIQEHWSQELEQDRLQEDQAAGIKIARIPGDASTRRYYRLGANGSKFILMRMEDFKDQGANLPFIQIQQHLKNNGVDVPEVHAFEAKDGLILLEDLGDMTLLHRLKTVDDADTERQIYQTVIDSLVQLQVECAPKGEKLDAFKMRFDLEKLMWEVNFTLQHFYDLHLKRDIKPSDRQTLVDGFTEICQELDRQPTVFTHRDFHSRNVMCVDDRSVMIDFQDARMGPAQYDLASLLKDSYYQLEETQVSRLIDYYIARWEAVSPNKIQREEFLRVFDLMAIQRNFKAIGSFASFINLRNNPTYLKYIGNTFENIRRTLLKYPEYSPLREVLFHYYYF